MLKTDVCLTVSFGAWMAQMYGIDIAAGARDRAYDAARAIFKNNFKTGPITC